MGKSGYLLLLAFLTLGVAFAGCIVEYEGNEAGAGAAGRSTGGTSATGGSASAKGGSGTSGAASTGESGGCSLAHHQMGGAALGALTLSLSLALSLRRRRRLAA